MYRHGAGCEGDNSTRAHMTRLKKRVGHGVCPCCTKSFANLREHMRRQHPQFVASEVGPGTEFKDKTVVMRVTRRHEDGTSWWCEAVEAKERTGEWSYTETFILDNMVQKGGKDGK